MLREYRKFYLFSFLVIYFLLLSNAYINRNSNVISLHFLIYVDEVLGKENGGALEKVTTMLQY